MASQAAQPTITWQDRVRKTMNLRGLSQRQVADKIHRSQSTLACWLNGRNVPNLRDIELLSKALDVDPAYIAFGAEAPSGPTKRILKALGDISEADADAFVQLFQSRIDRAPQNVCEATS